jgi:MHS family metabolite:H+ symporter-like MFS transporter
VIAGGIAPLIGAGIIAWMDNACGSKEGALLLWVPIAGHLSLLTLLNAFATPETRGRPLDDPRDAVRAAG